MARTIILTKPWTMHTSGVTKPAGTELTFFSGSDELREVIASGCGYPVLSLPVDMPGRDQFIKAGYDTMHKLRVIAPEWTQVKGIGKKTAKDINRYFTTKTNSEE